MTLKVTEFHKEILTHLLTPTGPLPPVLDPDGVYPYQSYCETSARPVIKKYHFVKLENDYVEAWICPDLGGKVYSLKHKPSGKECLYVPDIIRHSRILPRFNFVAGGIEVSFPISHTPSLNEKVCYEIKQEGDRIYVAVGEKELRFGMHWTVEFSLEPDDHFLTQRTLFKNPTMKTHPWMSWSNAAVPAFEDSEFQFPFGSVLLHSDELKTIDWETEGPKTNSDVDKMSGYFWQDPEINAFGCYSPSNETGLYHIAESEQVPGMKLWSYGMGRDLEWSYLSTADKQSYLEIQAGPISDQSIKYKLDPEASQCHTEFWIPENKRIEIEGIGVPEVSLRTESEMPLFSYARKHEVQVWTALVDAFKKNDVSQIPAPESLENFNWAPNGIPNLGQAFQWVIQQNQTSTTSYWQLYYGVWLIANDETDSAILLLKAVKHDIAKAVLARIYAYKKSISEARKQYSMITGKAFQLHPQIVVERDKVLESFGKETFDERTNWLEKLEALDDEMIIERKIYLLIDMKKHLEAKELLLNTRFQKIHQRYERKSLWKLLCKMTSTNILPFPENLGEDNLAKFGAYREFEEK